MMRVLIAMLGLVLFAHAGMLDFYKLSEAKKTYEARDYNRSAKLYEEVGREGNPQALFDAADAWFSAGDYQKALELYKSVEDPKLEHAKWHNIGNAYAHLGKIDEAIDAYKKALKIQEDEETRYNLELLEKLKREQQKRNQNKKRNQKNSDRQKKSSKQNQSRSEKNQNQNQNQKGEKGSKSQQKNQDRKSEKKEGAKNEKGEKNQKEKKRQQRQNAKGEKGEEKQKSRQMQPEKAKPQKNVPISDMELRKWNKILNQRGINTLMLPLPTKENRQRNPDETKPW